LPGASLPSSLHPMPQRLAELRRQRALVQQHLDWLDREIARSAPAESDTPRAETPLPREPAPAAPMALPAAGASVSPPVPASPPATEADAILDRYRPSAGSLQSDVRKGCLLYFTVAMVLFGLGVVALYFLLRTR
jgi:hypothetical protein